MKFKHEVQYYETDKMGITHHSNYIRWMEEARVSFLKEIGWDYGKLEEMGIISPVVSVSCSYKKPTTFPDVVTTEVTIREFNGVKLVIGYEMKKDDVIVCEAESSHCFIDRLGMPVRLKKQFPEFFNVLSEYTEK